MNDFVFYSPTKFIFGREAIDAVGGELSRRSLRKALIVYGGASAVRSGVIARVKASLDANGVAYEEMGGVRPNPELKEVRAGIALLRSSGCDCLLPVGGGSVIDCAKAIAFGAGYDGDVWDFFDGKAKVTGCLPIAVVLTLPAAGSEGSASCVISNDAIIRYFTRETAPPSILFVLLSMVLSTVLPMSLPTRMHTITATTNIVR